MAGTKKLNSEDLVTLGYNKKIINVLSSAGLLPIDGGTLASSVCVMALEVVESQDTSQKGAWTHYRTYTHRNELRASIRIYHDVTDIGEVRYVVDDRERYMGKHVNRTTHRDCKGNLLLEHLDGYDVPRWETKLHQDEFGLFLQGHRMTVKPDGQVCVTPVREHLDRHGEVRLSLIYDQAADTASWRQQRKVQVNPDGTFVVKNHDVRSKRTRCSLYSASRRLMRDYAEHFRMDYTYELCHGQQVLVVIDRTGEDPYRETFDYTFNADGKLTTIVSNMSRNGETQKRTLFKLSQ